MSVITHLSPWTRTPRPRRPLQQAWFSKKGSNLEICSWRAIIHQASTKYVAGRGAHTRSGTRCFWELWRRVQLLILPLLDNSESICTSEHSDIRLLSALCVRMIDIHKTPTVKGIERTLSASASPQRHGRVFQSSDTPITVCSRQAEAEPYFVIHSLTLPQRWSPYQLLHVALAGIWQRKDKRWEAYSQMFCSTQGLVKLSLPTVLRSGPEPIKSEQDLREYIVYLLGLHGGFIGFYLTVLFFFLF